MHWRPLIVILKFYKSCSATFMEYIRVWNFVEIIDYEQKLIIINRLKCDCIELFHVLQTFHKAVGEPYLCLNLIYDVQCEFPWSFGVRTSIVPAVKSARRFPPQRFQPKLFLMLPAGSLEYFQRRKMMCWRLVTKTDFVSCFATD